MIKYLSVAEGRQRSGLRLVLTAGVPGPWSESAKAVLNARKVSSVPVGQLALAAGVDGTPQCADRVPRR